MPSSPEIPKAIDPTDQQLLKTYHEVVLPLLEQAGYKRIDPRNFENVFSKWEITESLEQVEKIEARFGAKEKIGSAKGEILEAIIMDMFELNWATKDVYTVRASKYDDYKHGVDLILFMLIGIIWMRKASQVS